MSQITYNNIVMDIVKTNRFHQESVYDKSDTDQLYMKFTVNVSAVVAYVGNAGSQINPANVGEVPADAMVRIRHLLAVPRRPFLMTVNGHTLLQVSDPPDITNGPKPRVLGINKLTENTFLVEWVCELSTIECDNSQPFLSMRYRQTVTYDKRWYQRIRTTGYLIARADLRQNADALRAMLPLAIPAGFQREPATYTLTEDGLRLDFSIEDHQVYNLPPSPALKASGKVFVSSGQGEQGFMRFMNIQLQLEGDPATSKTSLAVAAITIAKNFVDSAGGPAKVPSGPNQGAYLYQGGIGCDIWDNTVHLQLSVMLAVPTGANKSNYLNIATGFLDQNPLKPPTAATATQPAIPAVYTNTGTQDGIAPPLRGELQLLALMTAAFSDNCLVAPVLGNDSAPSSSPVGDAPPSSSTLQSISGQSSFSMLPVSATSLPVDPTNYFDDQLPGVYSFYKIVNDFVNHNHRVALPPCSSSGLIAVVSLAAPMVTLVSCWTAQKVGVQPEVPNPQSNDPNAQLLDSVLGQEELNPTFDGTEISYTLSGRYEYVYLDSTKVNYASPVPPYLQSGLRIPALSELISNNPIFGGGSTQMDSVLATPANA